MMQPLTLPIDATFLGEFAQHAIERRPVRILGAEGARDLARADFAGALANKDEEFLARGKGAIHRLLIGRVLGQGPLCRIIRQLGSSIVWIWLLMPAWVLRRGRRVS